MRDYQDRLDEQRYAMLCRGLDLDTPAGLKALSHRIQALEWDEYNKFTDYYIREKEQRGISMDAIRAASL